jgi:hypothetical protein
VALQPDAVSLAMAETLHVEVKIQAVVLMHKARPPVMVGKSKRKHT